LDVDFEETCGCASPDDESKTSAVLSFG